MSRLLLNVPYSEKNEVKHKGGRWDPEQKTWFVREGASSFPFIPWIRELNDDNQFNLYNEFYFIAEVESICWNCNEPVRLYSFCLPRGYKYLNIDHLEPDDELCIERPTSWISSGSVYYRVDMDGLLYTWRESQRLSFACYIMNVNPRALSQMKHHSQHWRAGHSKTAGYSYRANHCPGCLRLQGDFIIHKTPGGEFLPMFPVQAEKINLYKVNEPIFINGETVFPEYDFFENMTHIY